MKKVTIGIKTVDEEDHTIIIPIVRQENPPEEIGLIDQPIDPTV